ncbi:hypothetical protein JMJ35_004234 [Cladonia borealis]|uniref:dihydroneopterin aldolase n=1 Tax=Cladonia borealis TaxID=184061 RepID=A0AA39R4N3_9LECA|nr:hypothetical protein JMJ35_004234 [Cladonia borealis]
MSQSLTPYLDTISLRELHTTAIIGPDAWNRLGKAQPLVLSLFLTLDTSSAGASDDVNCTFSYGQMCKDVLAKIGGRDFHNIHHLTSEIADLANTWPGETLKITAMAPKALLRVDGGFGRDIVLRRKEIGQRRSLWDVNSNEWFIRGLNIACIIGVNEHERLEKQVVNIGLKMRGESDQEQYKGKMWGENEMWRSLVRRVCEVVEVSSFQTLEALAALIARTCLAAIPLPEITVTLEKPSALTFVEGAGVEITRRRDFLQQS